MVGEYKNNIKNLYTASFWFSIKDALVVAFLSVYLLRLNAFDWQIALVESISAGVGLITLFVFTKYLDGSRKKFMWSTFADRAVFLVFAVLLFFVRNPMAIVILYGIYAIPYSVAAALSPNYTKEIVPKENWGKVFAYNKMVFIVANMLALLLAGRLLDYYNYGFPYNFIVMFFCASISYALSYLFLRNIKTEVQTVHADIDRFRLLGHVNKNMFYLLLFQAVILMLAPLWPIYNVRFLGLSDLQIGLIQACYAFGGLLVLPFWGKLLDKMSNKKLFIIIVMLMCIIPIGYMISRSFGFVIFWYFICGVIAYCYDVALQNTLMASSKEMKYDYVYMANFQIYLSLVRIVMPPLGIMLFRYFGIVEAFIILGCLRFAAAFIIWYGFREKQPIATCEISVEG